MPEGQWLLREVLQQAGRYAYQDSNHSACASRNPQDATQLLCCLCCFFFDVREALLNASLSLLNSTEAALDVSKLLPDERLHVGWHCRRWNVPRIGLSLTRRPLLVEILTLPAHANPLASHSHRSAGARPL